MNITKPKATHEGELIIGDKALSCAVLDNGIRVITATAVFQAFDRPRKGKSSENYRADQMPSFVNANNLQPFIDENIKRWTDIIEYSSQSGASRTGYDARILRGLCMVYISARRAGVLHPTQEKLATISEAILYALADVGITALVDEATGYQYDRENDELQRLLRAYVSEELLPWQKMFPDEYYRQIFKLNGWNYTLRDIRKRPGIVGKWTNILVYNQLPEGVLEQLKERTPKSQAGNAQARYHQSLTADVGHPHLTAQINKVIALMQASEDWQDFNKLFNKMAITSKEMKEVSASDLVDKDSKKKGDSDRFHYTLFDSDCD